MDWTDDEDAIETTLPCLDGSGVDFRFLTRFKTFFMTRMVEIKMVCRVLSSFLFTLEFHDLPLSAEKFDKPCFDHKTLYKMDGISVSNLLCIERKELRSVSKRPTKHRPL